MYYYLILFHSLFRWLALIALILTIGQALIGYSKKKNFLKRNNLFRHGTATLFHIQLIIGVLLLVKSPIVQYFWRDFKSGIENIELLFFGLWHPFLMLISIVVITIGSAKAKRETEDTKKFKTILIWYSIGLIILFLAIPWSFSPFVSRPNFRAF
ncbi:MAG: hypothetical protein AAFO07_31610 [Bacteroidota bacterium]